MEKEMWSHECESVSLTVCTACMYGEYTDLLWLLSTCFCAWLPTVEFFCWIFLGSSASFSSIQDPHLWLSNVYSLADFELCLWCDSSSFPSGDRRHLTLLAGKIVLKVVTSVLCSNSGNIESQLHIRHTPVFGTLASLLLFPLLLGQSL